MSVGFPVTQKVRELGQENSETWFLGKMTYIGLIWCVLISVDCIQESQNVLSSCLMLSALRSVVACIELCLWSFVCLQIFGPIMPFINVKDVDEVIDIVTDRFSLIDCRVLFVWFLKSIEVCADVCACNCFCLFDCISVQNVRITLW